MNRTTDFLLATVIVVGGFAALWLIIDTAVGLAWPVLELVVAP